MLVLGTGLGSSAWASDILNIWTVSPECTLANIHISSRERTQMNYPKDFSSKHLFWPSSRSMAILWGYINMHRDWFKPPKLENLVKKMQSGHKWDSTLSAIWVKKKKNQNSYNVQLTRGLSNTSHLGRNSMKGFAGSYNLQVCKYP